MTRSRRMAPSARAAMQNQVCETGAGPAAANLGRLERTNENVSSSAATN
jgi:hypothetical protein